MQHHLTQQGCSTSMQCLCLNSCCFTEWHTPRLQDHVQHSPWSQSREANRQGQPARQDPGALQHRSTVRALGLAICEWTHTCQWHVSTLLGLVLQISPCMLRPAPSLMPCLPVPMQPLCNVLAEALEKGTTKVGHQDAYVYLSIMLPSMWISMGTSLAPIIARSIIDAGGMPLLLRVAKVGL